ncbi:hypothetical protein [Streptomyces sp. NPDC001020]
MRLWPLGLTCLVLLRVAPVPSPPGTPRTQIIGPLAQSATAMHISTRLLF